MGKTEQSEVRVPGFAPKLFELTDEVLCPQATGARLVFARWGNLGSVWCPRISGARLGQRSISAIWRSL